MLWLVIHVFYLIGFKNRVTTLLHWAISFIGRGRAQRTTTSQQLVGRNAVRALDVPDDAAPGILAEAAADAIENAPRPRPQPAQRA